MSFDLVTTFPTLQNAPITEAVIDIRVERRPNVTLQELSLFTNGFELEFPNRAEQRSLKARIDMSKGEAPPTAADGYVFKSLDQKSIVQVGFDGLTISRLNPYENWSVFAELAKRLWQRYIDTSHPTKVVRLGVRYINRIDLDIGSDLFGTILTGPQIALALPQNMLDFFMRLLIPDESGAVAIIHQTFSHPEVGESTRSLIFDVDAIKNVDIDPRATEEISGVFEELRRFKNRVFFNSLTNRTLERYR